MILSPKLKNWKSARKKNKEIIMRKFLDRLVASKPQIADEEILEHLQSKENITDDERRLIELISHILRGIGPLQNSVSELTTKVEVLNFNLNGLCKRVGEAEQKINDCALKDPLNKTLHKHKYVLRSLIKKTGAKDLDSYV